ncbi:MAG: sucA, partial [Caulobacteraceae bacterium]|nr:sucA [Caulobacteraceae bacterium]
MADDSGRLNQVLTETSFLYGGNAAFVEALYAKWATDPSSVEASWQAFFSSLREPAAEVKAAAQEP